MLTNKKGLDFVWFTWKANSCQHDSPYSCHLVFFLEKEASHFFLACACEAYWIDTDVPRDFTAVTDLLYLMVPYFDPLFDLGVEDLSGSYRQLEKFAYILCLWLPVKPWDKTGWWVLRGKYLLLYHVDRVKKWDRSCAAKNLHWSPDECGRRWITNRKWGRLPFIAWIG